MENAGRTARDFMNNRENSIERNGKATASRHIVAFDEFSFDAEKRILWRGAETVLLAPKACELLNALIINAPEVLSKEELMTVVWADSFVEEANLTHHISALRKALGEDKNGRKFIETIPRKGYRFVAPIVEANNSAAEIIISERVTTHAVEKVEIETGETERLQTAETPLALKSAPRSFKTIFKFLAPAVVCSLLFAVSLFAFRLWRQNNDLKSFDALRSVKLTAWKSTRSNDSWNFKSSHNGNMMAYSSSRDGIPGIYVKQVNGGEDLRITKDDRSNSSPIWSPDDRQIMFSSVRENQAGIYICPSLGGTAILVKIIGEGNLSLGNWSRDGAAIYYEFNGNLFKLNIESKESLPLTNFPADKKTTRYFRVSPNEDRAAYSDKTDGQTDLWTWNFADGSRQRLTNDTDIEVESAWHPDNNRLFYQVQRNNIYQISLVSADGGEPVQITRGDRNLELIDVSPDGTKLFYYSSEDKSDIGGLNVKTNEKFEIAGETESEFWADVSPDGNSVSYLLNSHQFALQRLVDSSVVVRPIAAKTAQISFKGANQRWLPDSRRIAFVRFEQAAQIYNLWTYRILDGEEKQITTAGITAPGTASFPYNRKQTRDFSWSDDSRRVVYIGAKRQNVLIAETGGETKNLTANENPNLTFHCPLWSSGGRQIAYISSLKPVSPNDKPQWSVWIYADGGAAREIFSTAESLRLLGWSETGDLLLESTGGAMKSEPIDIKLLQTSPLGTSKIVNSFEQISALSMNLSPDAKAVVYTKETNGKDDIYLAEIGKTETKKLTDNPDSHTFFGSLTWLPDNQIVYFDKQ